MVLGIFTLDFLIGIFILIHIFTFSAVRHRYLCGQGSGLFQEDIAEALGVIYAPSQRLLLRNFNTNDLSDCKLMDLIRHLVISRDVASLVEGRLSLLYSTSPEYLQSSVDSFELNALINGIMGVCGILQERQKYPVDESFLHPWGYQVVQRFICTFFYFLRVQILLESPAILNVWAFLMKCVISCVIHPFLLWFPASHQMDVDLTNLVYVYLLASKMLV